MKKFLFYVTVAGSLLLPATSSTAWASYDPHAALTSARADLENWMKYLPDDVYVAHVSIPGSHDSATGHNVTVPSSSKAQEKTIDEQLVAGLRAFDLRPGTKTVSGNKVLNCNHGVATTDLTLHDAMVKFTDFLKAHPSEFLCFHWFEANVKSSSGADIQKEFSGMMEEMFNNGEFAQYIADFDPCLKVKDVRGKIIIFKRDRLSFTNVSRAGNLGGWPSDSELWTAGTHATVANASDITNFCNIRVTDVSSPDSQEKFDNEINSIKNLFSFNCSEATPNEAGSAGFYKPEWTMIFTSGEYKLEYQGEKKASGQSAYLRNATFTNPLLTQLINDATESGPTGMVFADWVLLDKFTYSNIEYPVKGDELVTAVIENNFKYIKDYIIDYDIVKEETCDETDRFGSKEYYMRHVGTGQFLSAGADWGTHAVLHPTHGIRVTPIFNKRNGQYVLKTTFAQNGTTNFLGNDCYIDNTGMNPLTFVEVSPGIYHITLQGTVNENGTERAATLALTSELTGNTYNDGTTLLIQNRELKEGDINQQWELITEKDLADELAAKASETSPVDLSFMIHGAQFRVNDADHDTAWTFTADPGTTRAKMTVETGVNAWFHKDNILCCAVGYHSKANAPKMHWTLEQIVDGLPDGIYTFSCQALVDNLPIDNKDVFALTVNGIDLTSNLMTTGESGNGKLSAADAYAKLNDETLGNCLVESPRFTVEDGKVTIRAKKGIEEVNNYNKVFFDNFGLMYYGSGRSDVESIGEETEKLNPDSIVDVYNIDGVILSRSIRYGDALRNLDRGIYLVRTPGATVKIVR